MGQKMVCKHCNLSCPALHHAKVSESGAAHISMRAGIPQRSGRPYCIGRWRASTLARVALRLCRKHVDKILHPCLSQQGDWFASSTVFFNRCLLLAAPRPVLLQHLQAIDPVRHACLQGNVPTQNNVHRQLHHSPGMSKLQELTAFSRCTADMSLVHLKKAFSRLTCTCKNCKSMLMTKCTLPGAKC